MLGLIRLSLLHRLEPELESMSNLDLNRRHFCGLRTEARWNLRPKAGRLADLVYKLLVSQGRMSQDPQQSGAGNFVSRGEGIWNSYPREQEHELSRKGWCNCQA